MEEVLENGNYAIYGNEKFEIDKIQLKSTSGANRVWKLKEMSENQVIFEIEKFG